MGNESSKSVAFISDIEPAESNSDADAGSQVLDHSTASIKKSNTAPIVQSSPSEDAVERDEGSSFRTMSLSSEMPDLPDSSGPIPSGTSVKISSRRTTMASPNEYPFPSQLSQIGVADEQTLYALNNLSVTSPGVKLTTPFADDSLQSSISPIILNASSVVMNSPIIDANVQRVSTSRSNEHQSAVNQLSIPRSKLKPHAPEFIPRRELYDNIVPAVATFAETTNSPCLEMPSEILHPIPTKTKPMPQRQSLFEGRDLPPHLSFRDGNHLYRPVRIRAPPPEDDTLHDIFSKDPYSPKIAYPPPLSPSGIVQVTAPMEANEYNIPSVATYADATNLAIQYPDIASEILVHPLSSVSCDSSPQKNHDRAEKLHPLSRSEYEDISGLVELREPEHPPEPTPSVVTGPLHTYDAPNWAAAPFPPPVDLSQFPSEEPRRTPRNRRRRNESNQNRHGNGDQRWDSQNHSGEKPDHVDRSVAWVGSAAPGFYQPPAHGQLSFRGPRDHSEQNYESADKTAHNAWDRPITPSFRESPARQQPPAQMHSNFADTPMGHGPLVPDDASSGPVPAVCKLTVEEEAAKILSLARMYNVDIADLLRLVESSRTTQAKTEEEQFHKQPKVSHRLLHAQKVSPDKPLLPEEVVDDRFWNTPYDMLPENSWGDSRTTNTLATSPSHVFVPTYVSAPAPIAPMSTYGRGNSSGDATLGFGSVTWNEPIDSDRISAWSGRGGSAHAACINGSSNSLAGSARGRTFATGNRREPSLRQRINKKYYEDSENVTFEVVDKLEGSTKEVYLRHGSHVSSKAASSRALADTNNHPEEMKIGAFASDGTAQGGYGTSRAAGGRIVVPEQQAHSHGLNQSLVSWGNYGNSAMDNAWA